MADEPESLVLKILQEIQATQAEHTRTLSGHTADFASIKDTLRLHGMRLDNQTAMFEDIGRKMAELKEFRRREPSNAEIARDLRALEARVAALESQQQ